MHKISVSIVDEVPIFLDALISVCKSKGLDVVASGRSADDAIKLATEPSVDILILDPMMQGGMDAIRKISADNSTTKVIALSSTQEPRYAVKAIEAGARGYVVKESNAEELIEAVISVSKGEIFISPSIIATKGFALREERLRKQAAQLVGFSIREIQIARLLLRGRTNKEIATDLEISEKTVKCYMTTVLQKLNARNRIEAVLACQKIGLLTA